MNKHREFGFRQQGARKPRPGGWEPMLARRPVGAVILIMLATVTNPVGATEPAHVPVPGGLNGKTCYECHIRGVGIVLPSSERPKRYSIASAFLTYFKSPHGRLRRLGDARAPMCEDCHLTREWRYILPRENPASPINPANLPAICAKCHGAAMLAADVASGSMHLELRADALVRGRPLAVRYGFLPGITKLESAYYLGPFNLTATVYFFFLALTVGTLTFMSSYLVLDLLRKLAERRLRRKQGSP